MFRIAILATLSAACMLAQPARVGTFDKPSVVVAYYHSPQWAETLRLKHAELAAAQKANDTKKVGELNAWGGAQQELAGRQLAGEAPIDNIMEALAPALPEITRKAGVSSIVADPPPAVETVDVTALILDWLKANAQTRRIINGLHPIK